MALLSDQAEAYLKECHETGVDVDRSQVTGLTSEDILSYFYESITFDKNGEGWKTAFDASRLLGQKLARDLVDADSGEVVAKLGDKMTQRLGRKLSEAGLSAVCSERMHPIYRHRHHQSGNR